MDKTERAAFWDRADGYNRYIQAEFASFRKDAWTKQICDHFGKDDRLDILDAGCGPGFFSVILSSQGHRLTGIDQSEDMLRVAEENANKFGVSPVFIKMDINDLEFEDDSFDVIVTRNVTWTLEYPEKVYSEFRRVLRSGGMLLIYDANWHLHFYDDELMKKVRAHEQAHFEKYGVHEVVSGGDYEYYATAPLTRTIRPAWDVKVLTNLGFDVETSEDIGAHLYEQWEKDLYQESPLFEICAVKHDENIQQSSMREYWQERSKTFGFAKDIAQLREIGDQVKGYLPEGRLKVLDCGCGPGAISAAMGLLGHDVTGVDLSRNMINKARENTSSIGLRCEFICTAAGELPFGDDTFDVVISRNLTWALPEPEQVFTQWRRGLKPGGLLIYWDGNHYLYWYDDEMRKIRDKVLSHIGDAHQREGIDPTLCDETARYLPMSRLNRPSQWDDKVLPVLGFDIIAEHIQYPQNLVKYGIYDKGSSTQFLIVAKSSKQQI